jgi:chemotaxis methyl-accepting protein methylase
MKIRAMVVDDARLIRGIWELLRPRGYLSVGHSESLLGSSTGSSYVQPAIRLKDSAKW